MGEARDAYRILVGNYHFEDRGDGRITLRWILERVVRRRW
jgi:hypothetical protein